MAVLAGDDHRRTQLSVLFVDDNAAVTDLAATMFGRMKDIDVTTETDPENALSLVTRGAFDCVVSDYRMPGMDGLAFCRRASEAADVPCIVFTSADDADLSNRVHSAGFDIVYKHGGTEQYRRLADCIRETVREETC